MTRDEFIQRAVISLLGNRDIFCDTSWLQKEKVFSFANEMADFMSNSGVPFDCEDIIYVLESRLERIEESLDNIESTIKINMK